MNVPWCFWSMSSDSLNFYRAPTKFREGNVFSLVCLSVCLFMLKGDSTWPMILWTSPYTQCMLKLHYLVGPSLGALVLPPFGKRVIVILLICFLVWQIKLYLGLPYFSWYDISSWNDKCTFNVRAADVFIAPHENDSNQQFTKMINLNVNNRVKRAHMDRDPLICINIPCTVYRDSPLEKDAATLYFVIISKIPMRSRLVHRWRTPRKP